MDVLTPGETSPSATAVVVAALAVVLSAMLAVPGLALAGYAGLGATLVLGFGVVLATRTAVSTVAAALPRDPPPPVPDEELPSVSLVVTAYNEAGALPATIRACTALEYPADRLEVVVGYEQASADATGAIARAAAAAHDEVVTVERTAPPGGKASATNHLLDHATGEIVAVLDADQRPDPGMLRRAVRWFDDPEVACLKGRCHGTNPGDSLLAACATVERGLIERTEFYVRDRLGGFALFTGGQAFFRADVFESVGRFDESILLEDLDMAYRIQRAGGAVRVDPGVVTRESNPATLTAWWNQRHRWARGGLQVARRYLGRLGSGPPPAAVRADFGATLGALLCLPVAVLGAPLLAVAYWQGTGPFPLGPVTGALFAWVLAVPVLAPYLLFALDRRDGYRHQRPEWLVPLVLWPYFAVQGAVVVGAFLVEFVLRRPAVYVTSTTSGE